MKTRLLFLFSCMFIVTLIKAQITVTNSVFPTSGDVLTITTSTNVSGVNVGMASAAAQTWDFSSVTTGNEQTINVMAANNSTFPNANITNLDFRLNGNAYFSNTGNTLEMVGFSGDFLGIGVSFDVPFANGSVLLQTPLTMNTTFIDSSRFQVTETVTPGSSLDSLIQTLGIPATVTINALRVIFHDTIISTVDAHGQLTIDGFSAPFDVLRQKNLRITNTQIQLNGVAFGVPTGWVDPSSIAGVPPVPFIGIDTFEYYIYYNNTSKEPIARVNMDSTGMNPESVERKSAGTNVFGIEKILGTVQAFPNPASDYVTIDYQDFAIGTYQVKLFSLIGQELQSNTYELNSINGQIRMNVSDVGSGIYLYNLMDSKGRTVATERIIITKN